MLDRFRSKLPNTRTAKIFYIAITCVTVILLYKMLYMFQKNNNLVLIPNCDISLTHSEFQSGYCHEVYSKLESCYGGKAGNAGPEILPNFYLSEAWTDADLYRRFRNANIAFVHLPKTGGTSVEELMDDFFVNGDCHYDRVPITHCSGMHEAVVYQKQHETFFSSKRSFGVHRFMLDQKPFIYVTWFRDPVTRFISTFYYVKLMKPWYNSIFCYLQYYALKLAGYESDYRALMHIYVGGSGDLTEFISKTNDVIIPDFNNYLVRLLQFGDFPEMDENFEDCCGAYTHSGGLVVPRVTEQHYLVAKRNLENLMAFVGLTEDFGTSQTMLCDMFELPCGTLTYNVNGNKHKEIVSAADLAEIRRRNYWDLKLYEDAKSIYEKQKQVHAKFF